jgi:hypothetical protein
MTVTTMPLQLPSIRQVLLGLLRFDRGHSTFVVGDDEELVYQETVATVKMNKGETIEQFHTRIRAEYDLRRGDRIEILNNGGRVDTARITLLPR